MSQGQRIPQLYTSILYLIGFLLFLEWLYPTSQIAETSSLHIFIIYTFFCMMITLFSLRWWFSLLLKGLGLLIALNIVFFSEPLISTDWFYYLLDDIVVNIQALLAQQWYYITPLFRTLLFLLIIWLMSYLIHYWFVVTRKFLLFVILTIVYLSIIDTFTVYNATGAIVRTFILSFIALGLANFFKELKVESLSVNWRKRSFAWVFPLIFVVLFSAVIGYASPKYDPKWEDPVPFLQSMSDHIGFLPNSMKGDRKVGYGDDDSLLGGSFVDDQTLVFEAISAGERYWRVDTKDLYTGKGWKDSGERLTSFAIDGHIKMDLYDIEVQREANTAVIKFNDDAHFGKLPYPYETLAINSEQGNDVQFEYDTSGAITAHSDGELYDPNQYGLTYFVPTISIEQLKRSNVSHMRDESYFEINMRQYTQVPDDLPDRIVELAEEITEPYESDYDKAKAVESYFGRNGFVYETKNIPYPEEDQDYVDQFLFETKYGYCDNFSTSMVVMLRTLGIPARWAKGFTSGELVESNVNFNEEAKQFNIPILPQPYNLYEITNSNAHSWVEVYFPEVGWVPFEPTQGFSNLAVIEHTEEEPEEEESEPVSAIDDQLDVEDQEPIAPETEDDENTPAASKEDEGTSSLYLLFLLIPVVIGLFIYIFRVQIKTLFISRRLKHSRNAKIYEKAYLHLLNLLSQQGYSRDTDQTLREYAKQIDHLYRTEEMGQLTNLYEKVLYKDDESIQGHEISQLWESLIKRVIA